MMAIQMIPCLLMKEEVGQFLGAAGAKSAALFDLGSKDCLTVAIPIFISEKGNGYL